MTEVKSTIHPDAKEVTPEELAELKAEVAAINEKVKEESGKDKSAMRKKIIASIAKTNMTQKEAEQLMDYIDAII